MATSSAIVWFRRDLRLADNPALDHALTAHDGVVPVFIWDPDAEGRWAPGSASRWWLHHSLVTLNRRLLERGSRLIIRRGDTAEVLDALAQETGAQAVYWNRLYEPSLVDRDARLKKALRGRDIQVKSFNGALLFEPWEILKPDQTPYQVFTPYWKRMQRDWRLPPACVEPQRVPGPSDWPEGAALESLGLLPELDWADGFSQVWTPGEEGAGQQLSEFLDAAVTDYDTARDRPDQAGTSRLSAHLHFGELSPRQVAWALDETGQLPGGRGKLSLLREIVWREFSWYLMYHYPSVPETPLKSRFEAFPWRTEDDYAEHLAAWQRGQTGIPIVDAGMRELWATGWMHNRVRMIVASFLTKNLLIPWQVGADWFWDTLVDADLGNNTQGWQWVAGCGADAAPYFRIFNPVLQGQKFDPAGDYVRRWCPELSRRPRRQIHEPLAAGESCGAYPRPIVDLKASRQRALDAYAAIKD